MENNSIVKSYVTTLEKKKSQKIVSNTESPVSVKKKYNETLHVILIDINSNCGGDTLSPF